MMRRLYICAFLLLIFLFSGCSFFAGKKELPADELAEKGMEAFDKGDYSQSIEYFENLKDWYPFNRLAILAELKIADAYFNEDMFDDAISGYEEFENMHPNNEAVPYCIYRTGMSYYKQLDTVDRDQTMAKKALETFDRLIDAYPESEYAKKAEVYRKKSLKSLANHELYVAKFYMKQDQYEAALKRFEGIIKTFPDVGMHNEALHYIGLLREKLSKKE